MPVSAQQEARTELHARLEARRAEIEEALTARVFGIQSPDQSTDPTYTQGLRASLEAALEYGMEALRLGERRAPALPTALAAQARMAARNGVGLDTVLRRYVAGHAIFTEFVIEEAERGELLPDEALQRALRGYAAVFDRLIAQVSEEHAREARAHRRTSEERRAERIRRLLAGEPIDVSDLHYELDSHHLALIARGPGASEAIRSLAEPLGGPRLLISPEPHTVWGWLASSKGFSPECIDELAAIHLLPGIVLAIGEPAHGTQGWRATHHQAREAIAVAERSPDRIARYRDVAVLTAMLKDELLLDSLRALYLEPLERHREGDEALVEALEAYFSHERNVSSAAVAAGLDRRTLTKRLRTVEELLDRRLEQIGIEIEAVLRLRGLGSV
jgi:DNA-binding PucR family transcriptional regulator